jgi:hypothetical protein
MSTKKRPGETNIRGALDALWGCLVPTRLVANPAPRKPYGPCTPFFEMLAVMPWPPTESEPPRLERWIQRPGMMRMRLRNLHPIGFWFLCWVPSIEVFPLGGGYPAGTKKAVAGQGDTTGVYGNLVPLGPFPEYSAFVSAGHQLSSGCEHRL